MHFGFFEIYAIVLIVIAVVVAIASKMVKHQANEFVIPRAEGNPPGGGNNDGALIEKNICPVCGEEGFYVGQQREIYHSIYCGNPKCRAAFMIVNYGPGRVWAHRDGQGPQHLYQ
jgi:hypothetical protein